MPLGKAPGGLVKVATSLANFPNPPWTPVYIDTAAWYDAADEDTITSGVGVSQWDDKSGNGRNATQGTGANQPETGTRSANNRNVLDFDGDDDVMVVGGTAFSLRSIFVVANNDDASFVGYCWPFGYKGGTDIPVFWASSGATQINSELPQKSQTDAKLYLNGDTDDTYFMDFAPLADYKILYTEGTVSNTASLTGWLIGDGDANWDGGIAEIIIFDDVITTATRRYIEGYLAWKWGLEQNLPYNHPFRFNIPYLNDSTDLLWTPEELTPNAWYDASDTSTITESSGAVSQWDDKTTNGRDLSQGTGSKQPTTGTRKLNKLNALDFDPSGPDNLTNSSLSGLPTTSHDFYAVQRKDTAGTNQYTGVADSVPGDGQIRMNRYADDFIDGENDASTGFGMTFPGESSDTNPHLLNWRWSGSVARMLRDGVQLRSDYPIGGNFTFDKLILGSNVFGANQGLDGILCEFIWTEYLSDADRYKVEGYLAWKWGLQDNLPANHPYKDSAPRV